MRPNFIAFILFAAISSVHGQQEWKIETDVVIFEAVVSGTPIKVVISEKAFDPAKHKTTEPNTRGTEDDPIWIPATVDGRPVLGTDSTLPPMGFPQLSSIVVHFGEKKVEVPPSLMSNVFNPHDSTDFSTEYAHTIISVSSDAKCVLIDLGVGDGGGSTTAFFAVSADGKSTTEHPQRPGE